MSFKRESYTHQKFSVVIVQNGRIGVPGVFRAFPVWAVVPTKNGMKWLLKRGLAKRGSYWFVPYYSHDKVMARSFVSDNYANQNWPKGSLMIVRAFHTDRLHDGIYA
ncbi:MAG: hypothetical protein ACREI9_04180 [Nitrospiraceae bacterium]